MEELVSFLIGEDDIGGGKNGGGPAGAFEGVGVNWLVADSSGRGSGPGAAACCARAARDCAVVCAGGDAGECGAGAWTGAGAGAAETEAGVGDEVAMREGEPAA